MSNSPRFLCVLLAGAVFSSCYTARITTRADRGETYDHAGATLLWGLTTTRTDADECPRGLAQAETYYPWWGYIVSTLTVGIVTPIRKEYTCVATPSAPVAATPTR